MDRHHLFIIVMLITGVLLSCSQSMVTPTVLADMIEPGEKIGEMTVQQDLES